MRKTIVTLFWNIAPVLPYLFVSLLAAGLSWREIYPRTFQDMGTFVLGVPTVLIFIFLLLQPLMPPDLSSWWYRRLVKKNRARLAEFGLTAEQYMDTLPNGDLRSRARAKVELGID